MELKHETQALIGGMPAEIFELSRAAGLSVCDKAQSTFNRQVANFAAAVTAPLQAEIGRLKIELAELRQARAKFDAPACPPGHITYEYCAGTSMHSEQTTTLVCHLEYSPAMPETEAGPAEVARVTLIAAYHRGVNVLETLVSKGHEMCIEEDALREVMS